MDNQETQRLVDQAFQGSFFNTTENTNSFRDALRAAYKTGNYPALCKLESTWQEIQAVTPEYDRDIDMAENPLLAFQFITDIGYFPPPEILLAVSCCIKQYLNSGGNISLDEAFFGKSHKKTDSFAYAHHKEYNKYGVFHLRWAKSDCVYKANGFTDISSLPLETRAEQFLDETFGKDAWTEEIDLESFLRGYRRWVNDMR